MIQIFVSWGRPVVFFLVIGILVLEGSHTHGRMPLDFFLLFSLLLFLFMVFVVFVFLYVFYCLIFLGTFRSVVFESGVRWLSC